MLSRRIYLATGGAEIPSLVHTVIVRDWGARIGEPQAESMNSNTGTARHPATAAAPLDQGEREL